MGDSFGNTLPRRMPSTERPGKPWKVEQAPREAEQDDEDALIEAERQEVRELEKLADRLEQVKQQLANAPGPADDTAGASTELLTAKVLGLHLEGDGAVISYRSGDELKEEIRETCYIDADGSEEELARLGLDHLEHGGKLLIYGEEARVLARVFGRELRRPLRRGLVDVKRDEAMAVLEEELRILREARAVVVAVVVPDVSAEEASLLRFHEELLRGMLEVKGRKAVMVPATEAAARECPGDAQSVAVTVHVGADWTGTGLSFAGITGKKWGLAYGIQDVLDKASGVTSVPGEKLRRALLQGREGEGTEMAGMAARVFLGELFGMVAGRLAEEVKSGWPEKSPGIVRMCGEGAGFASARELMEGCLEKAGLRETFGKVEVLAEPEFAAARGAVLLGEAELKKRAGG